MRNLTIKRRKSFVVCLAKIEIYIEDSSSNDFLINNTPCRKIGDIKNSEEKTFQITGEAVKIFIIADKSNKNYCKTYYQLTSSDEDIFISGKCKFDVANGFHCDKLSTEHISICKNIHSKRPLLLKVGIIAVISPIPMLFITAIWSIIFSIYFGIYILGYSTIPNWMTFLSVLPLTFSPLFDVFGIVLGALKFKERHSILCIILSAIGLLLNFILIFTLFYIGSHY